MDILSLLSGIISNSIPSVAIMLAGLLALFVGSKTEQSHKNFLTIIGYIFLISGALLTGLISILQIQKAYAPELSIIWQVIEPIFSIRVAIILFLAFIVVLIICWLRILFIEHSYKLQITPVINADGEYANMLINNLSNGTIYCLAKLKQVVLNGEEKDVNKFNPDGLYLRWDNETKEIEVRNCVVLKVEVPEVLHLVYSYGDETYFDIGSPTTKFPSIGYGKCTILVEFYRLKNKGFVKFDETNETLEINRFGDENVNLEWIK
jgi:hypothetical protein